jgi:hypothetical protein
MADVPDVVSKTAILQSITTEASGFYTTITTVASSFLGASLLFFDKLVTTRTAFSTVVLALSWVALVAAIACVARVRYLNLKSGQLALREDYDRASIIDTQSGKLSTSAQWCLILGMTALVIVGVTNVNNLTKKENISVNNPNSGSQNLEKTIPYGSLKPSTAPVQQPPAQAPTQTPMQTPASTTEQGQANK